MTATTSTPAGLSPTAGSPAGTIEAGGLLAALRTGPAPTILDVRTAAEFGSLHIRGAAHVPLALLAEHAGAVAARLAGPVVLACQSGARAEQARRHLSAAGFDGAAVLAGGVPGFAAAGGTVVRGTQAWALERQVRLAAGSLVALGLAGGRFVSPKLRLLAGTIGSGLVFSALTDTCAMGRALAAMPWNRGAAEPDLDAVLGQLPGSGR